MIAMSLFPSPLKSATKYVGSLIVPADALTLAPNCWCTNVFSSSAETFPERAGWEVWANADPENKARIKHAAWIIVACIIIESGSESPHAKFISLSSRGCSDRSDGAPDDRLVPCRPWQK